MAQDGIEEIMIELATVRRALEQKRKDTEQAKQSLAQAAKQAKALQSEARRAGEAIVKPAENVLSRHERDLMLAEHRVLRLEELLFVALQVIEQRISED